jgi:uncharacterized protein (DUF433 family)
MLHDFLAENRDELIRRCRKRVRERGSPPATREELAHGVPLFLGQLVDALRYEAANSALERNRDSFRLREAAATKENTRTATLHGSALLQAGYSVEQVVHDYGDLCQSITELAKERNAAITLDEFRTLNRLLDNAIADAVSSYGRRRDEFLSSRGNESLHERMGTLAEAQRELLDTALKALDALKIGNIGVMGATGQVLEDCLAKLRGLVDQSPPEIPLSSGMTAQALSNR